MLLLVDQRLETRHLAELAGSDEAHTWPVVVVGHPLWAVTSPFESGLSLHVHVKCWKFLKSEVPTHRRDKGIDPETKFESDGTRLQMKDGKMGQNIYYTQNNKGRSKIDESLVGLEIDIISANVQHVRVPG